MDDINKQIDDEIQRIKTITLSGLKEIADKFPLKVRGPAIIAMGEIIVDGKRELQSLNFKDKRIDDTISFLEDTFIQFAQGKRPF